MRAGGVFHEFWRQGLLDYDQVVGIDWAWLACDGAMTKAPLGGPKTGPNPTDRAKKGRSGRSSAKEGSPGRARARGANRNEHKLLKGTLDSIPVARREPTAEQPQGISLDRAYGCADSRELVDEYALIPRIRRRGEEIHLQQLATAGARAAGRRSVPL